MAKWSVALFGHHKPRFELREIEYSRHVPIVAHGYYGEPYFYDARSYSEPGKGYAGTGYHKMTTDIKRAGTVKIQKKISQHVEMPVGFDDKTHFIYNVVGWEKRAEPSDIIGFKQYGKGWTENEKKLFLIITLDNLEESQANALCESLWDTDSYKIPTEFPKEPEELYPTNHLKKRRFHIPMNDLKSLGVDEGEMLCPDCKYVPQIRDIQKLECFDKLNSRYVLGSDGMNTIRPIIYGGKA